MIEHENIFIHISHNYQEIMRKCRLVDKDGIWAVKLDLGLFKVTNLLLP